MRQIFLVSDRRVRPERELLELLEEAASAGVDRIQLREKDLEGKQLHDLACAVVEACRPHGCRIYINSRLDVALASGSDGIHLPADGMPVGAVREAVGGKLEIGVSTHSLQQLQSARDLGADYAFLGPIFPTPGKELYGPPLGLDLLKQAITQVLMPVYPIGGMDRYTAPLVAGLPIAGIALVRGILAEPDIPAAVGLLRVRLSKPTEIEDELAEDEEEEEEEDEDEEDEGGPGDEGGWGYG